MRYSNNDLDRKSLLNAGFYKILTQLDKYPHTMPLAVWASKVLINNIIDEYRKQKKQFLIEVHSKDGDLNSYDIDHSTLSDIEENVSAEYLDSLMNELPDASKLVFSLHAVEGLSYLEISEKLQISKGTIKWHIHHARKAMKEKLLQQIPKKEIL